MHLAAHRATHGLPSLGRLQCSCHVQELECVVERTRSVPLVLLVVTPASRQSRAGPIYIHTLQLILASRIDAHLFDFCCNARPDHPRIFALARFQRPVHISGSSAASNSSTSQALQITQNTPLARHRTFYSPAPPPTVSNTVLLPNFFPQPIAGYFLSLCPQPDLMCMYLRRSRFITSFCLGFVCAVSRKSSPSMIFLVTIRLSPSSTTKAKSANCREHVAVTIANLVHSLPT